MGGGGRRGDKWQWENTIKNNVKTLDKNITHFFKLQIKISYDYRCKNAFKTLAK